MVPTEPHGSATAAPQHLHTTRSPPPHRTITPTTRCTHMRLPHSSAQLRNMRMSSSSVAPLCPGCEPWADGNFASVTELLRMTIGSPKGKCAKRAVSVTMCPSRSSFRRRLRAIQVLRASPFRPMTYQAPLPPTPAGTHNLNNRRPGPSPHLAAREAMEAYSKPLDMWHSSAGLGAAAGAPWRPNVVADDTARGQALQPRRAEGS